MSHYIIGMQTSLQPSYAQEESPPNYQKNIPRLSTLPTHQFHKLNAQSEHVCYKSDSKLQIVEKCVVLSKKAIRRKFIAKALS